MDAFGGGVQYSCGTEEVPQANNNKGSEWGCTGGNHTPSHHCLFHIKVKGLILRVTKTNMFVHRRERDVLIPILFGLSAEL